MFYSNNYIGYYRKNNYIRHASLNYYIFESKFLLSNYDMLYKHLFGSFKELILKYNINILLIPNILYFTIRNYIIYIYIYILFSYLLKYLIFFK